MYRVLKRGGRVAISDIVSDEAVPEHFAQDADLWSACVSGAFQEEEFLRAFEDAKFHGMQIEELRSEAYQTVEGIEFRAITVTAYKGKEGPCIERNHAAIYRGPWKQVVDDDGHTLERGARTAVCDKTFKLYSQAPYAGQFILVPPRARSARWKTPESSIARAITDAIRVRPRGWSTKSRKLPRRCAGRDRTVARKSKR